jgi:Na+/proline symporter
MSFSVFDLSIIGIGFLLILFGIAYAAEHGKFSVRLLRHPTLYILALGTFVSSWGFYGSVGMANQFGFGFLAYYLGICGAFLLAPVFLVPILRISRAYQLASLADLFAFRYRSQFAATITTIFSIAGMMPLMALQIKSVAHSVQILAPGTTRDTLGFLFCFGMVIFIILFGARTQKK